MSIITDMILTCSTREDRALEELNAWCDLHAERQRFNRIDMAGAGGQKRFTDQVWACAGNYFPWKELLEALWTFPWKMADRVVLTVRSEHIEHVMVEFRGETL